MKIYLNDDGGEAPKRGKKVSPRTTQASSRKGGFKPKQGNAETYDAQGFGGAGVRHRGMRRDISQDESMVEAPEYEEQGGVILDEDGMQDFPVEPAGDSGEPEGQEPPIEEDDSTPGPQRVRSDISSTRGGRRRTPVQPAPEADEDDDDYEGVHYPEGYGDKSSRSRRGANKPGKNTRGKTGGQSVKPRVEKPSKQMPKAAEKPSRQKPIAAGKSPRQKPVSAKKDTSKRKQVPVDDFDASFGYDAQEMGNDMPAKESVFSQIIGIVEIVVGGGLAFFGASQLANILINNILMK